MVVRRLPSTLSPQAIATPHITQLAAWDCGLACISMVLAAAYASGLAFVSQADSGPGALRRLLVRSSRETLAAIAGVQGVVSEVDDGGEVEVWTIDLAYLLRHFEIEDFTFFTSFIGVNFTHPSKPFYRDSLSISRRRIHALFADAPDYGVRVVPMVLAMDDVRRFLVSGRYVVVMLVDLNFLKCGICGGRAKAVRWCCGWGGGCCCCGGRRKAVKAEPVAAAPAAEEPSGAATGDDERAPLLEPMRTAPLLQSSAEENSSVGYLSFFWSAIFGDLSEHGNGLSQAKVVTSGSSSRGSNEEQQTAEVLPEVQQPLNQSTESLRSSIFGVSSISAGGGSSPPTGVGVRGRVATPPSVVQQLQPATASPQLARVLSSEPVPPIDGSATTPPGTTKRSSVETALAAAAAALSSSLPSITGSPPRAKPFLQSHQSTYSSVPPPIQTSSRLSSSNSLFGTTTNTTPPSATAQSSVYQSATQLPVASASNTPKMTPLGRSPSVISNNIINPSPRQSSAASITAGISSPYTRRPSTSKSTRWTTTSNGRIQSTSASTPRLPARSPPSTSSVSDDFNGHYILLVGYDVATDGFLYRDPGTEDSLCAVDGAGLEKARSAPGSDHDAVVVRVR